MRHAAATGSANTAVSSSMLSGTAWRFTAGSDRYSAKAPSCWRMPTTLRLSQCSLIPRAHQSQRRQPTLISPTTRLPTQCGVRRRRLLDDADELVAGDAGEAGVAFEDLEVGAADAGAADADEAFAGAGSAGQVFELDCRRAGDDECFHWLSERYTVGGAFAKRFYGGDGGNGFTTKMR